MVGFGYCSVGYGCYFVCRSYCSVGFGYCYVGIGCYVGRIDCCFHLHQKTSWLWSVWFISNVVLQVVIFFVFVFFCIVFSRMLFSLRVAVISLCCSWLVLSFKFLLVSSISASVSVIAFPQNSITSVVSPRENLFSL